MTYCMCECNARCQNDGVAFCSNFRVGIVNPVALSLNSAILLLMLRYLELYIIVYTYISILVLCLAYIYQEAYQNTQVQSV
jgi:hypothetical protein